MDQESTSEVPEEPEWDWDWSEYWPEDSQDWGETLVCEESLTDWEKGWKARALEAWTWTLAVTFIALLVDVFQRSIQYLWKGFAG